MKFFEEVNFEVIAFAAEDVITASDETRPGSDGGSFDGEIEEF